MLRILIILLILISKNINNINNTNSIINNNNHHFECRLQHWIAFLNVCRAVCFGQSMAHGSPVRCSLRSALGQVEQLCCGSLVGSFFLYFVCDLGFGVWVLGVVVRAA